MVACGEQVTPVPGPVGGIVQVPRRFAVGHAESDCVALFEVQNCRTECKSAVERPVNRTHCPLEYVQVWELCAESQRLLDPPQERSQATVNVIAFMEQA